MAKISDELLRKNKDLQEPEVHVIGELTGASDLDHDNAFALFELRSGPMWLCVGGDEKGQTQVDYPEKGEMIVWNHPIDVHYYSKTLQGWPRLVVEVYRLDDFSGGYGFCFVPTAAGSHELTVPIWRPCGTPKEEVYEFFLGGAPHLLSKELIDNPTKAKEERHRLYTVSMGKVHVRLDVVLRNTKVHTIATQ